DEAGVPGVWFYSLDCDQPLAVRGARTLTGLPYFNAEMSATADGVIDYSCRRDGVADTARYRYRPEGNAREADPHSLEFFLLERYYLYSECDGVLMRGQVSHAPYQFREAAIEATSALPAQWDG